MKWLFFLLLLPLSAQTAVVVPSNASRIEKLAGREVRRYFYLRTGRLLPSATADQAPAGDNIVVARSDRPLAAAANAGSLGPEEYVVKTVGSTLYIVGGGDAGTLYAAYRFAEKLGVRFYLHGDVVPDQKMKPSLPQINETGRPLFDVRGIQPFHDFPEGPDWWNQDDFLAYIAQLPKLRMNFLGLHNYPEGPVGPEPGVWIGLPQDADAQGNVRRSYPSQWANTARNGMWGYAAMKTSDFRAGADQLFETDEYGPDVMHGLMPAPQSPEDANRLFNNAGAMLRAAFSTAKLLGVKTCIGTETPLTIPKLVAGPSARELYEGMFRRIAATYPIDYYWLWTPEDWTWGGNKPEQFAATTRDIQAALDALNAIGKPFTLATSGWVLGPQHDRSALDNFLPKDSPMSTINRQVGHAPDEPGFAQLTGRPKWVIPWVENDPNLTSPQPWAGRMRYDAADARRLGCTGLLGIHWRTKILAANVAALASAAWEQPWVPSGFSWQSIDIPAALGEGEGNNNNPLRGRTMPVEDLYVDFARANFGDSVAETAGKIFARIDGVNLPEPATWIKGPGGIKSDKRPWAEVKAAYAFVDDLARLRGLVRGPGNLERFDYWLNTYRYMAAIAEAGCLRGELDRVAAAPTKELALQAISLRTRLARLWEKILTLQIAATDTPGELGTLANLEQHNRVFLNFLTAHDSVLAKALDAPLPEAIELSREYKGPARIIVPTVRTLASKGESLQLKFIAIDQQPVRGATVFWRPLGQGSYRKLAATHVARAVYRANLPPAEGDLEYYIEAQPAQGRKLVWPATAPALSQTVVALAE